MPLLQLIFETGAMLIIGLLVITQVIVPLWFGKKTFWLFRRRSGKAHVEIIPPGRSGPASSSYASNHSFSRGSVAASHEKRAR